MGENPSNQETNGVVNGTVKDIAGMFKGISDDSTDIFGSTLGQSGVENTGVNNGENNGEITGYTNASTFKVSTNLPEKTGVWTKIKNVLLCEIKVELTPYQQKIEDEINEFLHQEVTWQSFKNFLFQEVPVTYKGKRIF